MQYKTIIWDRDDKKWNVECTVTGKRPVYEDMMTRSSWIIPDFEISNIKLECDGQTQCLESTASMPDVIDDWQIKNFEENAFDYFLESWIDCQEKAYALSDEAYDASCGN